MKLKPPTEKKFFGPQEMKQKNPSKTKDKFVIFDDNLFKTIIYIICEKIN
jgi:hypothetical protein